MHLRQQGIALCLLCSLGLAARADIYKYVDKQGIVHLSDRRLGPGYRAIVRTWKGWVPKTSVMNARNRRRFTPLIERIARQQRLDKALIHAVIAAESAYDPRAISRSGAVGLMQLMPATARRYGVGNRRDPGQNVRGGVRYLRDLLLQFDNLRLALAAYNAGENAVIRYGNRIPPYRETRDYVRKVLAFYRKYRKSS